MFKENPQKFLKKEYEIVDIIDFPIKILSTLLNTMPLDNKTDPFQLFLYTYFRTKMKVVYLEAYVKEFEEKIPWDLVAYDKDDSNKLYFVEITTGHPAKRVLKKFPAFIESIDNNGIVIYITPLKRAEKGIKLFLEYVHKHHQNNFFVVDSSFEPTIGETRIGEKARKCFDNVILKLENIVNSVKTN